MMRTYILRVRDTKLHQMIYYGCVYKADTTTNHCWASCIIEDQENVMTGL